MPFLFSRDDRSDRPADDPETDDDLPEENDFSGDGPDEADETDGGTCPESAGAETAAAGSRTPGFLLFLIVVLSLGICAAAYQSARDSDETLRQMVQGRSGIIVQPRRPGVTPRVVRQPVITPAAGGIGAPVAGTGYDAARARNAYNRSRALMRLARPLGTPRPGDWLTVSRETPESFFTFVNQAKRPVFPTGRRTLVLTPVGDQSPASWRSLEPVTEFLAAYFGMGARTAPPLAANQLPPSAWRVQSRQRKLVAEYCITNVLRPRLPSDGAIMIGITGNDLTPGGPWAFESAFGWSSFYGRAAIVSTFRVVPGAAQRGPTGRELEHIVKLALHEAGHAFALKHCSRHECLINGRCSLEENARKPLWLCPECHAKLMYATGFDPGSRARRLSGLARRYGFASAAQYWERAAQLF